jgi:hypothetical protein
VRDIDLYLLEHTHWDEGAQAIYEWPEAGARQARRHAHHVLLGDPGIDVLRRAFSAELIKQRVAMITRQKQNLRISLGDADQRLR